MDYDLVPLILTLKLAVVTTVILITIGIPVSYWLSFTKSRWKYPLEALVSLPLVLPPTVLGFYLSVALGSKSWLGGFLSSVLNIQMVFSFAGLVVGSVIYSLPFMVNPLKSGFEGISYSMIEIAQTLGKSRREIFLKVLLPLIQPSVLTAVVMSFAHTIGEFGVVLMIGGNIPGETRLASIAIFSEVEALNYKTANFYSVILVVISFCILCGLYWGNRRSKRTFL